MQQKNVWHRDLIKCRLLDFLAIHVLVMLLMLSLWYIVYHGNYFKAFQAVQFS